MDRGGRPLADFGAMPAPVKKLSDRFADFVLTIRCRKCAHERTTEPHALAKLLGWETPLTTGAQRMRCSSVTRGANVSVNPALKGRKCEGATVPQALAIASCIADKSGTRSGLCWC
jgi:hypothetical protein